ncbi:MAG: hypothetical protein ACREOJ_05305 [Gemmatimonadaceae bacterium]
MHFMYQCQTLWLLMDAGAEESRQSVTRWKALLEGAHDNTAGAVRC